MAPETEFLPFLYIFYSQDRVHAVLQGRFIGRLPVNGVHVIGEFMVGAPRSVARLAPDPFLPGRLSAASACGVAFQACAVFMGPVYGQLFSQRHGRLGLKRGEGPGVGSPQPLAVLVSYGFGCVARGADGIAHIGALFPFRGRGRSRGHDEYNRVQDE